MQPLTIEIITHAPTEFFHCQHCELVWRETGMGARIHAEQRTSSLPPNLAEEYARIGDWARALAGRHGDRVRFRVVDVLSLEGFYKSVRHRLGRFPAYIVDGRRVGGGIEQVEAEVKGRLGAQLPPLVEERRA